MTSDFVDLPHDGRSKYPKMLEDIKRDAIAQRTDKWQVIASFKRAPSARDTVSRLKKEYLDFEFSSRLIEGSKGAQVFARYKHPKRRPGGIHG